MVCIFSVPKHYFISLAGFEKKNDDLRRYFHSKINRWDAATNLLLVEKRQEVLRDREHAKRSYEKKRTSFCFEGGKAESARKVVRISTTQPQQPNAEEDMNESQLKKKKVSELITILKRKSGKIVNKKTRKQDVISALLQITQRAK